MSKASLSLLSRFRAIAPPFSRNYVSGISLSLSSTTSSSPLHSTHVPGLNLIKTHPFQTNPSRNIRTPPHSLSWQMYVIAKPHIVQAFGSAKTAEQMLAAFQDMEASLDDADLGLALFKVGFQLQQEGKDPEKALSFADKALKALDRDGQLSVLFVMTLHLLGCINITLKRFDDSLGYLTRAYNLLCRLEEEGITSVEHIRPGIHAVQTELGNLKRAMGRIDEALENYKKALEISEMTLEMDGKELGVEYRDLASGYLSVSNFKEALPFALKALDIHKKELGHDSVEVAHDRRIVGAIYSGAGEHKMALEQFELSRKVFKHCSLTSELLSTEMDAVYLQILLGKFDEAINTLKDSKGCLDFACQILDKKEAVSLRFVAQACIDVANIYEVMDEFETAVSFLNRALGLIENEPEQQHAEGTVSARIGWMLLSRGEVPRAIPYLETVAERFKESLSSKHFVVGHNYNNLGVAYLESDRPQSAAQMFAAAKNTLDVSRGPYHADSIVSCRNLSIEYGTMGSYALAVEFQQQVIDALKFHGQSALDVLAEAHRILEELKRKALVVDLEHHDRNQTILQILKAGEEYGFFQVINHGVLKDLMDEIMNVAEEFLAMPWLEKERECSSKDPKGSCKLYTSSYAYPMEDFHYWRDALTHPCLPSEEYI
ncbi:hypothetical protein PTKIN_Ptkin15bG0118300 [Pterospermum kingtungense]